MTSEGQEKEKKIVKVILLGCGGVGRALLQRILATRAVLYASSGLHLAVVAVCDSHGMLLADDELDDSTLKKLIISKAANVSLSQSISSEGEEHCTYKPIAENGDLVGFLHSFDVSSVVVDCTASEETAYVLAEAAKLGYCVVLANKKPLTSKIELYDQIVSAGRRFRCESTVGAGLPVMSTLYRTLSAGDPIHRIVGALSGTLGYVMSGLQEGKPYSAVVTTAKSLGYTEPDPRDDLSGMDVARKALIMARSMGWRINMEDVEVESLYPSSMGPNSMSTSDFLAKGLLEIDEEMQARVEAARDKQAVLRYVATIENGRCKVSFMEVDPGSALGRLQGSDNLLEIYTDCYENSPLVIQGAGAGNDTTAAGVLADIVDLQDLLKMKS